MDAIDLLIRQHRETEELFQRFEQASGADERLKIVMTTISELRLHTTIEEEIFYPAVRAQGGELEQAVLEDLEEHHIVEVLLDELESLDPDDERFAPKFEVITELVQHHVEEEEEEQFPLVLERMDREHLRQLGEQMLQRYQELEAEAEAESETKDELYARARELGVEGRSQMTKRQLAHAIRTAG